MSIRDRKTLDQARDTRTQFFARTAKEYDRYLSYEYEANYRGANHTGWEKHFTEVRSALHQCFMYNMINVRRLPKREKMNFAIVGPGEHPMGRDFDQTTVDLFLKRFQTIVVIDFSRHVIKSAVEDLVRHGIPRERVYAMEFDITGGLSTAYAQWIEEKLKNVTDEEGLMRISSELARIDIRELDARIEEYLSKNLSLLEIPPDEYLAGGVNLERTFKLSTESVPLPLHLISMQMIGSGTGAHAEAQFWSKWQDIIATQRSESTNEEQPSPAVLAARRQMLENVHTMISRYNTEVTENFLLTVLSEKKGNPDAVVLSIADVSTQWEEPHMQKMPRLHVDGLIKKLRRNNIDTANFVPAWQWHDEPEHFHFVEALQFERGAGVVQQSPSSPIAIGSPVPVQISSESSSAEVPKES